jgi:2-succinyl-5-enolpyruvyl-6-hydroxy-3-cyclohexene-1-carboxylate synthase
VKDTAQLNREQAILIAKTAIESGVQHAVLSPGARNTPVVLALHDMRAAGWPIALHSVIDERAAGFFALGLARRCGAPVLLSCTSGSAGANYYPAVVEASEALVPLIVVTADRPEELHDCGAPQTMNQRGLFGPHVRRELSLGTPENGDGEEPVYTKIAETIAAATGTAPGPVHINAMFRKPLWRAGCDTPQPPNEVARPMRTNAGADRAALDECIRTLAGRKGAIVAGPDANGTISGDSLVQLGIKLGWPVLADPVSTARNIDHPVVVRHHDGLLRSRAFNERFQPEVLVCVGGTPSSRPLHELIARTNTIRIDPTGRRWDPWQSVTQSYPFDIEDLLGRFDSTAESPTPSEWVSAWARINNVAANAIDNMASEPLWEGAIAARLIPKLPHGTLLRLASSMPIRDADSFGLRAHGSIRVSSNRGVNGIDGLIATTLGEATAHDGPTVALVGDLSFLHDSGSLGTVPAPAQPVVLLILDNSGGAIFSYLPMADHPTGFDPWFTTPHSTDMGAIAEGHGIPVHRPHTIVEVERACSEALNRPGISVIHVPIDASASKTAHTTAWVEIVSAVEKAL